MRCKIAQRQLVAFLDGELDPKLAESFQGHLTGCAACSQVEQELRRTNKFLRAFPQLSVPTDFTNQVLMRTEQVQAVPKAFRPRRLTWVPRVAAPAAAALAAVVIFLAVSQPPKAAQAYVVCNLEGLMCQGCAKSVTNIFQEVEGVRQVEVDLKSGTAKLWLKEGSSVTASQLQDALARSSPFMLQDVQFVTEEREG